MTISRHAGANARSLIRIDYGNRYSGELPGGPLKDNLLLDQKRLRLDLKHWQSDAHHLSTAHNISMDEFLAQVMDADNIQLLYNQGATISLHGMKPVLELMDEVQGRQNSMSAWVKRGDRPAYDVPPEPKVPLVLTQPHPPKALSRDEVSGLIDYGTWRINTDECSLDPQRRQVSVSPLTDEKALLLISCEMGAYNVIDLAFEVTREQPYVGKGISLKLPFTLPGQGEKDLELVNAEYDAANGVLLTFSKDRGLGDCGVATRWQFNGQQFELAEYAREGTCDAWHSSDDWPTLWTSIRSNEPQTTVTMEADK